MRQFILFEPESTWEPKSIQQDFFTQNKVISLDLETCDPGLKEKGPSVRRGGYIAGIALGAELGCAYYPIAHEDGGNLAKTQVLSWLKSGAQEFSGVICGANLSYDLDFLAHIGIKFPRARFHDVLLTEPILDENAGNYSLDRVAKKYLGRGKDEEALIDAAKTYGVDPKSGLYKLHARHVGQYAEMDAQLPLEIYKLQLTQIEREDLRQIYDLEHGLIPLMIDMRQRGIRVDLAGANALGVKINSRISALKDQIKFICGFDLPVWEAQVIGKVLKARGLFVPTTLKSKKDSISQAVLEANQEDALCQLILQQRKLDKLLGTFIEGYIFGYQIDGRIHPLFHQLRGEFGGTPARFSSSHPNLQNIPSRGDDAHALRCLFVPDTDEVFERLDWSQIEYRFLAHYASGSGAGKVRELYQKDRNTDFHKVCADLAGIKDRKRVKNVNFGAVYGAGIDKIAQTMGVGRAEAEAFLKAYHRELPFVSHTFNALKESVNKFGFCRSVLGRKRRFNLFEPGEFGKGGIALPWEEARLKYGRVKRAYTYKALNALLQDSAADLMKKAMLDIYKSGVCDILGTPLLTVHDELCFSRPNNDKGAKALREVHHIMETCLELKVPILASRESGISWGDCA